MLLNSAAVSTLVQRCHLATLLSSDRRLIPLSEVAVFVLQIDAAQQYYRVPLVNWYCS